MPTRRLGAWRPIGFAIAFAGCAGMSSCEVSARIRSDRELAKLLADDRTQPDAVRAVVADGDRAIARLLSWTRKPPSNVPLCSLYTGMADAFGELKTVEAIPFLVRNISLRRSCGIDLAPWLKSPKMIEWNFPAIGALVRIGPEAGSAVIRACREPMRAEDRLAAIYVVSRLQVTPGARAFLSSALGTANQEQRWAEEALGQLDEQKSK